MQASPYSLLYSFVVDQNIPFLMQPVTYFVPLFSSVSVCLLAVLCSLSSVGIYYHSPISCFPFVYILWCYQVFWHFHVFHLAHNQKKCYQEALVLPKSVIEKCYLFFTSTFLLYHLGKVCRTVIRRYGRCSGYIFSFFIL